MSTSPGYGSDFLLLDALDPLFALVSGPQLVLAAVYRRWTTNPDGEDGARIYAGRCRDIRQLLQARYDAAVLTSWQQDLAQLAKDDERVDDCAVIFDQGAQGRTVKMRGNIQPADGSTPFAFVIPFDTFKPEVLQ